MTKTILLLFAMLLSMTCTAQEKLILKSRVLDSKTRNDIPGVTIQLLASDSTVLQTLVANNHWTRDEQDGYNSIFKFEVPREKGCYILRASYLGYKTAYVNVSIGDLKKREYEKDLPPITLRPDSKMLQEVNVVGSKVKFYHKGDTVVYNADAFILAEGSMLDALVRQMPGVEIKKDGRIYHNGKFVENLLLNGKDFFKGNQEVMLENLPSYTVKQVKIYDKYGKKSEFLGQKREDDKTYVMDVNLKKDYSIGVLANLEGGAGTEDRYLGRLFAMRYTDHSRLTFYGNVNNLNDNRMPGRDTDWTPVDMPRGDSKEKMGGFDYAVSDRNQKFDLNGNVQVSHSNQNLITNTDRVNFLPNGNTYDYERQQEKIKNFHLATSNQLYFVLSNKVNLILQPKFSYDKFDNRSDYLSGTFSSMQYDVSRETLDKIYSVGAESLLRQSLINRYKKEGLDKGHQLSGSLDAASTIKLKGSDDYINLIGKISSDSRKKDFFNKYAIHYGQEQEAASSGNQYFKNHPDRNLFYQLGASYNFRLNQAVELSMSYGFGHRDKKRCSSLYQLDLLDDQDEKNMAIGWLPSVAEYEHTMDKSNSYMSKNTEDTHNIFPGITWNKSTKQGSWSAQAQLGIQPTQQRLNYQRGSVDTILVRNTTLLSFPFTRLSYWVKDYTKGFQLLFKATPKAPDLVNMVNISDATDPMNVKVGNNSLKNEMVYDVNLLLSSTNTTKQRSQSLRLSYTYRANALAMGYSYDANTGIRTYRAENVSGNWNAAISYNYEQPLDKTKKLTFGSWTRAEYVNSVDLIGKAEGANYQVTRNTVQTKLLDETLKLDYKIGSSSLVGIKASAAWCNIDGKAMDFNHINAIDFNYGITTSLNLPWHFQLGTDLTMYSRRGYEGSSMNTNDLLWNARLSYTTFKGKLTWMLDGFDILGNLNNITRMVNAQGRTETFVNALPRYAILHMAYHFSMKPKTH